MRFSADLLDGRQFALEAVGQGLDQFGHVASDADGAGEVALGVPEARGGIFEFLDKDDIVEPRNVRHGHGRIRAVQFSRRRREFCLLPGFSRRLREKRFGPGEIESAHPPDVACREARDVGKFAPQVGGQTLDNGLAPGLGALALDDRPANVPVQGDKFAIDGKRGLDRHHKR